ncbi:DUF3037 domain-containing protein [Sphingomonas sp. RT2P30]|uniref:DUF3037 domain-containing protein n=1 Tax=Parasphingomonas halimpatiens TaxID=3096162 RepID=UPI002FC6CAB8
MEHTYKYAILQVIPDIRRGERVNIGIVVFKSDGLDIRVSETRKLHALTFGSWDAEIAAFTSALAKLDQPEQRPELRLKAFSIIENQFSMQKTGWFKAPTSGAYESIVQEILKDLVLKRRVTRSRDGSTVVSEISAVLRRAEILANKDEPMESGKVFKNYPVSHELEADFAQLNSSFHVAAVLDLRASRPQLAQAALKAVVLDRAEAAFPDRKVHKIGVYAAAPARLNELSDNLAVLRPYADDLVNWEDPHDRQFLERTFYDAYNSHHPILK